MKPPDYRRRLDRYVNAVNEKEVEATDLLHTNLDRRRSEEVDVLTNEIGDLNRRWLERSTDASSV